MIDPFEFGETRLGFARAGEVAGRVLLFVPLGDGIWELLDAGTGPDQSDGDESIWTATEEARATFGGWDIDWVPSDRTRLLGEKYFRNLDPSIVWAIDG